MIHDTRGNAVWQWEIATGVFSSEVSPLKAEELSTAAAELECTDIHPVHAPDHGPASAATGHDHDPGVNPYDSSGRSKRQHGKKPGVPFMYQNRVRETAPDTPGNQSSEPAATKADTTVPASLWQRIKDRFKND